MAKEKRPNRRDYNMVAPEDLKIQSDPSGKFYDKRIDLPLIEETVLNIMAVGVQEVIIAVPTEEGDFVISGRQRTKHAVEANKRLRAKGSDPILVPVRFARDGETIPLLEIALNEHRQDDSPMMRVEKAMALRDKYSDEQISSAFRISPQQLKNWFNADSLCAPVKKMIETGKISMSAASKFSKLEPAEQKEKVQELIDSGVKPTIKAAVKKVAGKSVEKTKAWTKEHMLEIAQASETPNEISVLLNIIAGELTDKDAEGVKHLEWYLKI